jgi:hypothetical protein
MDGRTRRQQQLSSPGLHLFVLELERKVVATTYLNVILNPDALGIAVRSHRECRGRGVPARVRPRQMLHSTQINET